MSNLDSELDDIGSEDPSFYDDLYYEDDYEDEEDYDEDYEAAW